MPKRTKNNKPMPVLLIAVGVLLLIAGAFSLLLLRAGVLPGSGAAPTEDITYPDVERVTLEEAKAALDAGTAVFLDVRGAGAFAAGHIPGSLLIPLKDVEARMGELDPQDWIITYCT